ncbi:hypothetical protein U1Q18_025515 [Sarracenia purpurea var. burkii]
MGLGGLKWEAAEGDSSREEGSGAALASERRWWRSSGAVLAAASSGGVSLAAALSRRSVPGGGAVERRLRRSSSRRSGAMGAQECDEGRGGAMQWSAQGYPRGSRGAQAMMRVVTRLAGAAGGADSG